ncbi:MAG: transketolase [Proteobacteria bacterium]|nr:transketolase [Pseudomonadota bacterium]
MVTHKDLANAIRALAMDAVQKANSGHAGMPMGMADIAEVLWRNHLRHNPKNPHFPDRDRFVLSNGHGSMLLYALLHLTGYDLPLHELEQFRQLHSKTPGHPEYGVTPGVETTTGPLGQGIGNGVGMALAERVLSKYFNRPGHEIINHHTYVFHGDGCLMEGISHEACSIAGTLGLGKLIMFYDDNGISIDGPVQGWFTDNTPKRFEAYGWHVIPDVNGHDPQSIETAINAAKAETEKPSIICCKTTIGFGSPHKAGTEKIHGSPLGVDEIIATKEKLGWPYPPFEIPENIYAAWDATVKGNEIEQDWNKRFSNYRQQFPELALEFERRTSGKIPKDFKKFADTALLTLISKKESIASRKASQQAISALAPHLPELIGGSADLTESNLTEWAEAQPIKNQGGGNYIHFGVREFGMSTILNGMTLHGGLIAFSGTFLTFSDYARNALRLAALMKIGSIFIFTHDSIGLGEDGPTHQAIEQAASLRYIPNMDVWRPCDTTETMKAWTNAIQKRNGPSSLLLSRQNLAFVERSSEQIAAIDRGGYTLKDCSGTPEIILIATGSEIELALKTQKALPDIRIRVVSMPCTNLFDRQDNSWKESVLPEDVPCLAIEAGTADFWRKYVGLKGEVIGMTSFGESAPADKLFNYFGFTVENVSATILKMVEAEKRKARFS